MKEGPSSMEPQATTHKVNLNKVNTVFNGSVNDPQKRQHMVAVEIFYKHDSDQINPDSQKDSSQLMPIEGFPPFIQRLIGECVRVYGTHPDLWAGAYLAASASALGQSVVLKTQFENGPLLWIAVVAPSGMGKSEPLHKAFRPLFDIDHRASEKHKDEITQYQLDKKNSKKGDIISTPPPPCVQNILIDSTPEAMAKALSANPRGITILRDELHGWFMDFGRYSKSGEQQNMLSTWSQQPFKSNRANGENIFIKAPFINVIGGIQPGVLPEMAKENRSLNGFLQRFCFIFPDKIEVPTYRSEELSYEIIEEYRKYIKKLLSKTGYRDVIKLSDQAATLYGTFYNKNAALNNAGKQPEYLNEVNAKLNIIVLRIALVFHCAHLACDSKKGDLIGLDTMESAIRLAEYFRLNAQKVYTAISQTSTDKKEIAKFLSALGNSQNVIADVLKVSQPYINKVLKT